MSASSLARGLAARLGLGRVPDQGYVDDPHFGMVHASKAVDEWVRTTCGYCSVGCGMLVGTREGRAVAVKGDADHPVNHGRLCPKGLSEHQSIHAPGRLTTPLVREAGGGPLREAAWDVALDRLIDGFRDAQEHYGPESVAVLSTGQLVTEEFYALGKLMRLGLDVVHYDGNTTLCMASAVAGYKRSFGSDGPPGSYADIEEADCILLVGANIADNHPLLAPRVLDNEDATVIVVDPRVTKTAMVADLHLAIGPRSDISLINGMMRVIIDEGLVDADYVEAHTEGFEELVDHLRDYPLARVAEDCGVDPQAIWRAAVAFGRAERAFIGWTMGVNHSVQGTETVNLLNNLALITGSIGRTGAAPFSITGQCNAMGTREAGGTRSLPGYRAFDSEGDRTALASLWGVGVDDVPSRNGWAYPDIIDAIIDRKIRALWVIGTNPTVSFPNRALLEEALGRLDLLVVQDGFETPTTKLADVVLPAAIWGEKEGTFTNSERRVSRVRRAVAPPGEARSDFDIFLEVADRLGQRERLFPGWSSPEDAFEEWRRVSAGQLCDYSGITYERIDIAGGVQWPCPPGTPLGGTPSLYADGVFQTESGKAKLWCVSPKPITDAPRPDYPFLLNTGRTVEHWHTRTKTGRIDILESLAPEGWVEMHPADARRLKLLSGDRVRVASERGEIGSIPVRVTSIVREGEVFIPFHYDEMCANRLTMNEFDPISREPNYKQCAVRIQSANTPLLGTGR